MRGWPALRLGTFPPMSPCSFSSSSTLGQWLTLASPSTSGKLRGHSPSYRDPRKMCRVQLPTQTGVGSAGKGADEVAPLCLHGRGSPLPALCLCSTCPSSKPSLLLFSLLLSHTLTLHKNKEKNNTHLCTYYCVPSNPFYPVYFRCLHF